MSKVEEFEALFNKFIEDYDTSPIIEIHEDEAGISIDWDAKFYDKAQDLFDNCDEIAELFINKLLQEYMEDIKK